MACDGGLKDILQNMQTEIIKLVDLTYLLPILRRKRLVTETQFQMLSMESNPEERSKKLVRMVMGKGMNGFDLFVEALKEEREYLNHSILAKKLSQEKNRIKGGKSAKPPIPAPRTKKPVKSSPPLPPKPEPMTKLRRVHSEVTRVRRYFIRTIILNGQWILNRKSVQYSITVLNRKSREWL